MALHKTWTFYHSGVSFCPRRYNLPSLIIAKDELSVGWIIFSCEGAALEVQRWLCLCVCLCGGQVEICLSSFKCQPLPFKTKHRTSLILCTLVQWQVNQLKTRLECVHHVNNEYKCTLNFINQSFCQLKVSSIGRSHWWTLQYNVCWAAHKTLRSACSTMCSWLMFDFYFHTIRMSKWYESILPSYKFVS